jgi:PPOX class probable F420-dependent enzyme
MLGGQPVSVLPDGDFGVRVAHRLRDETVIWLTTVGADGTPQPNPVWFVWDGDSSITVYSRPGAHRLAHLAANPHLSLHFDGNGRGGDVVVISGRARRAPELPAPHENPDYLAKYRDGMCRVSGSVERFSAEYGVPLVIEIQRVRGF